MNIFLSKGREGKIHDKTIVDDEREFLFVKGNLTFN